MTVERTEVIGVRMGTVFDIAEANARMPLPEARTLGAAREPPSRDAGHPIASGS